MAGELTSHTFAFSHNQFRSVAVSKKKSERTLFVDQESAYTNGATAIAAVAPVLAEKSAKEWCSPVYNVLRVPLEKIECNTYNPNSVAPPEMALLETSIWEDGYTQPIVAFYDSSRDIYIVVDGFHRYLIGKTSKRIKDRENGTLPIVVIDKELGDRMASTIRHNRARGTHNIELMSVIVAELVEMGKGDRWICQHIGMSVDELLRLKQITGVAALFANRDFSDSWESDGEDFDEDQIEEPSEDDG